MKRILLLLFILFLPAAIPVSAETSYMDFIEYSLSWAGDDPDSLWRMTKNDVRDRLQDQRAFSCRSLFSSSGRNYYLCRSSGRFSGKYRMRFYFSSAGLLEAVEFRAEDDYIRELAECYDGQIPTVQTILKDIRNRFGESGRYLTIENGIFTDSTGRITGQAGIGANTYVVFGQNELLHAYDRPAILYVFCSGSYAAAFARR